METKRLDALNEDRSVADPIWVHIRSEAADVLSSDADLAREIGDDAAKFRAAGKHLCEQRLPAKL